MKTRRINILGISLLTIVILVIYFLCIYFSNKSQDEINIIKETPRYTLKIDYPIIPNKKINKEVKKYVETKQKEFIKTTENIENTQVYDFKLNYKLTTLKDVTTIHIITYSYTGGNHYIREDKVFRYITSTGEHIDITYFSKKDKFEELSKIAFDLVMEIGSKKDYPFDEDWVKKGTSADINNYELFEFSHDSLKITFVPFQVSSWADGEIVIEIPYANLKNIVKEEYLEVEPVTQVIDIVPSTRDIREFKDKKLIAFTFDDGPSGKSTSYLLDNLDKYNARVTFFVLGSRVNNYKDNLTRAYEMGNTIGSHTYNHLNLPLQSKDKQLVEITSTNETIKEITGTEPIYLRPPYGNTNSYIKENSNMYTILWNIDPEDWKTKNVDKIAESIIDKAHDGAIILLHDIYMSSVEGALKAMEELSKDGYAFVTIDEMFELKGITKEISKSYYSF